MTVKLFSGYISAYQKPKKIKGKVSTDPEQMSTFLLVHPSNSYEEALEELMLYASEVRYPTNRGYHRHDVCIMEVPHRMMMEYAVQYIVPSPDFTAPQGDKTLSE